MFVYLFICAIVTLVIGSVDTQTHVDLLVFAIAIQLNSSNSTNTVEFFSQNLGMGVVVSKPVSVTPVMCLTYVLTKYNSKITT